MVKKKDDPRDKGNSNISDVILGSLKSRTGKETRGWITNLSENKAKEPLEMLLAGTNKPAMEVNKPKQDIVGFMDHLFDLFQQYEFEFNKAIGGLDLTITTERPSIVRDPISRAKWLERGESNTCLRGRISSRYWTFVILGYNEKVEGYMLPIERYLTFTSNPLEFSPYLIMNAGERDGLTAWYIQDQLISHDEIAGLAKKLFACLVKFSRGEPMEEFFTWGDELEKKQIEASFRPTMEIPVKDLLTRLHEESGEQELVLAHHVPASVAPTSPINQAVTDTTPVPPMPISAPFAHTPVISKVTKTVETDLLMPTLVVERIETRVDKDFIKACNTFLKSIDKQLGAFSAVGAEAFQAQDMGKTEAVLRRAAKVKLLREQVVKLLAEVKSL